jgi:hypothetical protein
MNNTTARLAPEAPVKDFGNVLPHILDFMAAVPPEEHIHFFKIDLHQRAGYSMVGCDFIPLAYSLKCWNTSPQ